VTALIYHGTPITPGEVLTELDRRAFCISYHAPWQTSAVEACAAFTMYDCGAYSFWKKARRAGREWEESDRDWTSYYEWLDARLWHPGRWAIIPDRIAAPSQLNDALLLEWPHGRCRGAPVWHMDGPIERLGRLCDRYDRVCLGWVGEFDPVIGDIRLDQRKVGCDAWRARMDEVASLFGNEWPTVHMLRGTAVAADYPFDSADSTSLAQNGWRHDRPFDAYFGTPWAGRVAYADKLERYGKRAA